MSKCQSMKLLTEIESSYNPKSVEEGWYTLWESRKFFTPSSDPEALNTKNKWVSLLPPPNVTGSLHIGHALTVSIQDCLTRWHRMKGDVTLWLPGTDHAGIATQSVVERTLYKDENLKRHDLGRTKFVEKVFEWNDKYGSNIKNQLKRLGASLDWTREVFTMDQPRSTAVIEAFVRLYDSGHIYRNTRLVSWCPYLSTALSDIEVEPMEITSPTFITIPGYDSSVEVGSLWVFQYPVMVGSETRYLPVATTRLETMLGDVAVAVNPDDARYKEMVGCKIKHPFFPDREMVVVADSHVDMEFGTGAVKITPSHDKNDFEIAKRHGLPFLNIFTNDGKINENGGEFATMHRFQCRKVLEKRLKEIGLFLDKKPNTKPMMVPRCSRTGDIVEYMLIPQWYVNCKDLAKRAIEVVRNGSLKIIPSSYVSVWNQWLENIQDWCISRQLWWGHRIPAYRVTSSAIPASEERWVVGRDFEEAQQRAQTLFPNLPDLTLTQDEDVLDTWFSSGLFPLSTLGWPDTDTSDFKSFFPTSLLETGNDIIFFWVARMVMLSLHFVDMLPFNEIYMHPLVRDSRGEKMSKSKGNVVDPIDIIEGTTLERLNQNILNSSLPQGEIKRALALQKQQFPDGIPICGVDGLRLGLLALMRHNRAILLDVNKLVSSRHFGNKIWNATKFAILRTKFFRPSVQHTYNHYNTVKSYKGDNSLECKFKWEDKWILHKLNQYTKRVTDGLEAYQFYDVVQATYDFWLYQLCDVYLELVKNRLPSVIDDSSFVPTPESNAAAFVIHTCFSESLKLLHPIMPFITEELYHHLPEYLRKHESISISTFPKPNVEWENEALDAEMDTLFSVVHSFRSLATTLGLAQNTNKVGFITTDEPTRHLLYDKLHLIETLSKFKSISIVSNTSTELYHCVQNVVSSSLVTYINVDETVDLVKTSSMLNDRLSKTNKMLESYLKKLEVPNYEDKVPSDVRSLNDSKIKELSHEKQQLEEAIRDLGRLKLNNFK
ncbi:valine--tRNA ligase [Theileria parva strain Muguga]|uniref:valine--tRNA ligase n=1 Tax=Theileria parva strain Muguga TaxID=333668 RepID=UPI001C61F0CD|nr:valine--tRNA ligase [Theileria parva strain Muguga]EAN32093.2 valine--tRNA ligase [Theileria parva strain Muguga]